MFYSKLGLRVIFMTKIDDSLNHQFPMHPLSTSWTNAMGTNGLKPIFPFWIPWITHFYMIRISVMKELKLFCKYFSDLNIMLAT